MKENKDNFTPVTWGKLGKKEEKENNVDEVFDNIINKVESSVGSTEVPEDLEVIDDDMLIDSKVESAYAQGFIDGVKKEKERGESLTEQSLNVVKSIERRLEVMRVECSNEIEHYIKEEMLRLGKKIVADVFNGNYKEIVEIKINNLISRLNVSDLSLKVMVSDKSSLLTSELNVVGETSVKVISDSSITGDNVRVSLDFDDEKSYFNLDVDSLLK